ncbi:MAG: right-handed parallel beta-helix repeat-containing protein [Candidatus Heimdallarchaeaceae archaeon]
MKKIRNLIIYLILFVLLLNINLEDKNLQTNALTRETIIINSDADFDKYDFKGNGSSTNPYLIEDFMISIFGPLILIANTTKHFVIRNNFLTSGYNAIEIKNVKNGTATILNNTIQECKGAAILVINSSSPVIKDNYIYYCYWGIKIEFSDNCLIENNYCTSIYAGFYSGGTGLYLLYSSSVIIRNNSFIDNEEFGIVLSNCSFVLCENNEINVNGQGLFVVSCDYPKIINNNCSLNKYGVYFERSNNSYIESNFCYQNQNFGFSISESRNSTFLENTCTKNQYGISLISTYNITIKNSIIDKNEKKGLIVRTSSNSFIEGNVIAHNYEEGIYISGADTSHIIANRLIRNSAHGVYCDAETKNSLIYFNDFIENNLEGNSQAYDAGNNNTWYNSETQIGNFWSDYLFGAYKIEGSANSKDLYPLNLPVYPEDYTKATRLNTNKLSYALFSSFLSLILLYLSVTFLFRRKIFFRNL